MLTSTCGGTPSLPFQGGPFGHELGNQFSISGGDAIDN